MEGFYQIAFVDPEEIFLFQLFRKRRHGIVLCVDIVCGMDQ